jgi:hypothetical protein
MMETKTNKPPNKVFHCGSVNASIWLNPILRNDKIVQVPSIKINKSYKDKKSGEWENTNNLYVEDLLKVAMVANEVYRHFRIRDWENEEAEESVPDKSDSEPENNSSEME